MPQKTEYPVTARYWELSQCWVQKAREAWEKSLDGQVASHRVVGDGERTSSLAPKGLMEMPPEDWGIFPKALGQLPFANPKKFITWGHSNTPKSEWQLRSGESFVKRADAPLTYEEFQFVVFNVSFLFLKGIERGSFRGVPMPEPIPAPFPSWWDDVTIERLEGALNY